MLDPNCRNCLNRNFFQDFIEKSQKATESCRKKTIETIIGKKNWMFFEKELSRIFSITEKDYQKPCSALGKPRKNRSEKNVLT